MKRNDWAGGFWAKAAAFLLAVVLVPVLLSYGAALAFSYSGELRGAFYESSICSSAVYREMSHVYDSYHYYVENGQTEVLAKYDDWYPADDRYTNVRFSIEDEAGTILFDNHRTGDIPVTGWWGEMAQDGVVFPRRRQDVVARPEQPFQHHVESRRGIMRKGHVVCLAGMKQRLNQFLRLQHYPVGLQRLGVGAPGRISQQAAAEGVVHGLGHGLRLLRRRRGVVKVIHVHRSFPQNS